MLFFFFLILLYSKGILGKGNPLLPRCPCQYAARCTGLMHSVLGCPSTLPILEQIDRKQRRKLGLRVFSCSFFLLPPQHCMDLSYRSQSFPAVHASVRAGISCGGLSQMVGVYVCKCMVACVHECSHAWVWCALGCLLPVLSGGVGHSGAWLCVLAENGGMQKLWSQCWHG